MPKHMPDVSWTIAETKNETRGGTAVITRKLLGHVDNSSYPLINVDIELNLTTPVGAKGVPVIIEFFPPEWAARLPPQPSPSWQEQVIARGWAYAILSPTSIQADNGAGLTRGIIGLMNKGQSAQARGLGRVARLGAGARRARSTTSETDPAVDAKRAVIEGVSRYGKASLVTMAYEPRFAIGFIGSSGMGGAALHRRRIGELLENVAGSGEYHWMAGNYIKYAGPLTAKDLPVDAHELIALAAPRPLFIGAGSPDKGDAWVDPRGMFMATVAASPVYRLLGKRALDTTEFPPIETALTAGELAYRQHAGGHTSYPNWPTFLDFAQRYFEPK